MARKTFIQLSLVSIAVFTAGTTASAFVAPQHNLTTSAMNSLLAKGEKTLRPNTVSLNKKSFDSRFGAGTKVEVDAHSGAVRLITGDLSGSSLPSTAVASDFIDVATNWIISHSDILQVSLDDVVINSDATLIGDNVQFISFKVVRDSIPVFDASINFRFKFGKLVQIQTSTFGEALDDGRSDFVSATDAIERIASAATIQERGQAFRVVSTATGYKLVRVNMALVTGDGEKLDVQTEAGSGEIFEVRDTRHYAANKAHGAVYPRTYYQSTLVDVPMSEMTIANAGTSAIDGTFTATGSVDPSIAGVKGLRINTKTSTGVLISKAATKVGDAWDLDLNVTAEKDVAQTHTYYHVNAIIQKAKRFIDVAWMKNVVVTANVNLGQTCNAYWDGSTLNFFSAGGGCGNTGLISDVMSHEWGHGLDANTGGIADGAYSEGFGDILSMIMTNDSRLGPGFKTNGGVVRDMAPDKIYPTDRGEVHAEGLIIGGTFWDLLTSLTAKHGVAIANEIVSDIAFKTVMTASKYTDVYAAALVVNDNDSDTNTRSPDFCEINAAFTLHGLAVKGAGCP